MQNVLPETRYVYSNVKSPFSSLFLPSSHLSEKNPLLLTKADQLEEEGSSQTRKNSTQFPTSHRLRHRWLEEEKEKSQEKKILPFLVRVPPPRGTNLSAACSLDQCGTSSSIYIHFDDALWFGTKY